MKKVFGIFISIIMFFPTVGKAETYSIEKYGISISFSDDWKVVTRDNLKGNPILEEAGITYDYMNSLMQQQHMYLDAIKGEIEVFIRIRKNNDIYNFSNYSDSEMEEFGKSLQERTGADNYSIFRNNSLTFLKSNYKDHIEGQTVEYNLLEYHTLVNGEGITITAQKVDEFTDLEKEEIENLVKSIEIPIKKGFEKEPGNSSNIIEGAIKGAIIGGIVGTIGWVCTKAKKKKPEN